MKKMVLKAIRRYLRRHLPKEMDMIIRRADAILPELKAKAPDIGGKENSLSENLDMFLLFLSYYEASDHRMAGDVIDEIIDDLYRQFKWLNGLMNINRKSLTFRFEKLPVQELHKVCRAGKEKTIRRRVA